MPPKRSRSKFNDKDLVLAKMLGFPAWPSFIMPSEMIPPAILKVQKKSTNLCVIFIPDGDYNWMTEKQLEALTTEKLDQRLLKIPKSKLSKAKLKTGRTGRTKNVGDALLAARDLNFDDFMELLEKSNQEDDEDDEDEEEEEEEDEDIGPMEEVEQQEETGGNEEDDEAEDSKIDVSKQEDEVEEEDIRPAKRTRNGSSKSEPLPRKPKTEPGSTNGNGTNHKRTPSNGKSATKHLTEEEKQHQLWLCRIKLQRSLIQRNQPVTPTDTKEFPPPTVDELSVARLILHRLVDFPVDIELLRKTKIHKVLKCIIKDEDLLYPDSFKLHEKCQELLDKWGPLIEVMKSERLPRTPRAGETNGDKKHKHERLDSQPPDESEISAVENSEYSVKKIGNELSPPLLG